MSPSNHCHYSENKNSGQQVFLDEIESNRSCSLKTGIKLSNVEWDLIRRVLNNYKHSRGDTYVIGIAKESSLFDITIIVEFSSTTQYNYWSLSGRGILPLPPNRDDGYEIGPPPPVPQNGW